MGIAIFRDESGAWIAEPTGNDLPRYRVYAKTAAQAIEQLQWVTERLSQGRFVGEGTLNGDR